MNVEIATNERSEENDEGASHTEQKNEHNDEDIQCSICLDSLSVSDTQILPCIHKFHESCITEWLKEKYSCPICRMRINMPDDYAELDPSVDESAEDNIEYNVMRIQAWLNTLRQRYARQENRARQLNERLTWAVDRLTQISDRIREELLNEDFFQE